MVSSSYWLDTERTRSFPVLQSTEEVDVAIVGAGVTGITTAYLLSCAGFKVALIERDKIANADTGHTTAHLTYVTDTRLQDLVSDLGQERARDVWHAGQVAISEIEKIVKQESIDCHFSRVPGYLIRCLDGKCSKSMEKFIEEIKLAKQLDFDASLECSVPIFNTYGIRFADQAKFHPLKYLYRLVESIASKGGLIFEHTQVEKVDEEPLTIHTAQGKINCQRLIIVTHSPMNRMPAHLAWLVARCKLQSTVRALSVIQLALDLWRAVKYQDLMPIVGLEELNFLRERM